MPHTNPSGQEVKKLTRSQIQEELRQMGISQAALAEAAGISESHLAHVLAGRRTSRYVSDLLASLLGESIEIIPISQAKKMRPTKEIMDLRRRLFKPGPSTTKAETELADA